MSNNERHKTAIEDITNYFSNRPLRRLDQDAPTDDTDRADLEKLIEENTIETYKLDKSGRIIG